MIFRAPFNFRAAELRALADEALMRRVDRGDALAFKVIFGRHGRAAFSLAYRMCGLRTIAEEIVQGTFLSLWSRGGGYDRARGSVRSWVPGAVHNKAIDSFRHDQVRGELEQIPTEQRRVIELAYFGGFTHTQIAKMLELPAGTVKGRMRLGLVKLRLSLGDPASAVGGVR
jgi:RNA polymerase sigma-70 factor, ECF subfamily